MERETERIIGTIEDITYINEDNGYSVFIVDCQGEPVTVVGIFPFLNVGEQVELIGEYIIHPQYGQQFKAYQAIRKMPSSTASILKYLSSGAIKGIGPATAQMIVSRFGEDTLNIIENDSSRLAEIRGISAEKAKKIGEEFLKLYGVREVMLKLSGLNITSNEALRIYKKFGLKSIEKIADNPYLLCRESLGFSFARADEIATSLENSVDSAYRSEAGIEYILKHNLSNGHTCLPKDKLLLTAEKLLGYSVDTLDDILENMVYSGDLVKAEFDETEFIFLPQYYTAEKYCANRILLMSAVPPTEIPVSVSRLEQVERETGVLYDEVQKTAITCALSNGLSVLTGGPGTGKTTTLKAIISLLEETGAKIALAAPTGRAAKRMSELCLREAKTIHRLLEVEWSEDRQIFKRNEKNPLEYDCIIVDELSMMDIILFEALLKAMSVNCRLILVGDVDQLPSVGAGNVLNDIIESGKVPVTRLEKIFRQAQKSFIVTNAHRIIKGEMPQVKSNDSDFYIVNSPEPDKLITLLYCERLRNNFGFKPENIQVLCPSKKRRTGTVNINNQLQSIINPENRMSKKEISRKGFVLREGDKIMQIKNNYDVFWTKSNGEQGKGIFNGDIGVLEKIDKANSTVTAVFDDKTAIFTGEEIDDLTLAYAITVHKSQGSEFDCVILPVCDLPIQLKYRNLLYTAVTRAKKLLIIVGKGADIKDMVENDKRTLRYTSFRRLLQGQVRLNEEFL